MLGLELDDVLEGPDVVAVPQGTGRAEFSHVDMPPLTDEERAEIVAEQERAARSREIALYAIESARPAPARTPHRKPTRVTCSFCDERGHTRTTCESRRRVREVIEQRMQERAA